VKRPTPEIDGDILYIRILISKFKIPVMSPSEISERSISMSKIHATKARRGPLPQGGERLIPIE
jgi:hypothetical protein